MTELARRWAHTGSDPLLPDVAAIPEGEPLAAALPDGRRVGGVVYRATYAPAAVETLWEPRTVWEFTPLIGDTGAAGMDAALGAFRAWLDREVPAAERAGDDTGARVLWPSRDVAATPPLRAHGFVPMTAFAVRPGTAPIEEPPHGAVVVRRATTADTDDLVALKLAELRYSTAVTGASVRAHSASMLVAPLRRALLFGGRVLVAELDGATVGVASCGWASPSPGSSIENLLPEGRWGYVGTLSVSPSARGSGVGRALMAAAHRELLVEGVAGTYLYYDLANPLSSVFWPRQGYRPLWTKWVARPVSTVR